MRARIWTRRLRHALVTVTITGLALAGVRPIVVRAQSKADDAAFAMVDAARRSAHLPSLQVDGRLTSIARRQAERMLVAGVLFHNPALETDLSAADPSWIVAGENVGVGPSIEAVDRAFFASPEHRRNILGRAYDAIGIAVVTADDGWVYVTQVFARFGTVAKPAGHSCRDVIAEDGSVVPASFYGAAC